MAGYQALYRKWRPDKFSEVKGQDHVVRALKNQIRSGNIAHAYIFCGTRGTGKTSVAKLFAKTINCENMTEDGPCGQCRSCRDIAEGRSVDVVEIDAASNNGIESAREIKKNVEYPPENGRYRVYIIDEAHMITSSAWNALLKTIEEPPEHAVFIFATTEVNTIPATIRSRCQRYDFHRISVQTIADRLMEIMKRENEDVDEKALVYVARVADGSMRDALSLLDECLAYYMGEKLTYEKVLDVLGAIDYVELSALFRAVASSDVSGIMKAVNDAVMSGREMSVMVADYVRYLRNVLVVRQAPDLAESLDASPEQISLMKEDAALVDDQTLMRYIRIASGLMSSIRYSSQKRIDVEIAFVKMAVPAMETDDGSMHQRVVQLEEMVEELKNKLDSLEKKGITVRQAVVSPTSVRAEQDERDVREKMKEHLESLPAATLDTMKDIASRFFEIRKKIREDDKKNWAETEERIRSGEISEAEAPKKDPHAFMLAELRESTPYVDEKDMSLVVVFDREKQMEASAFESQCRKEFEDLLSDMVGSRVAVRVRVTEKHVAPSEDEIPISELVTVPVEEE